VEVEKHMIGRRGRNYWTNRSELILISYFIWFMIDKYESDKISVSLCLLIPLDCILICIISDMILLYQEVSLSKMWELSQSNSWLGSPLSPVIADIVMQDLETSAIKNLPFQLPFYFRYVDDIILTAPSNSLHLLTDTFNSQHSRLQFTMEVEKNDNISFLDLNFINDDGKLIFDLFKKPTFSGRYLSFYSHHPLNHKRGVIFGLTDKILNISHPKFQQKNFIECIKLLLINGYPLEFIFHNIHNKIKKFFQKSNNVSPYQHVLSIPQTTFFTVPFFKHISSSLKTTTNKFECPLAFTIPNSLSIFIKTGKDKIEISNRTGVVYKINCKNCDASYVGQTKRRLTTRIKEHRNDINKRSGIPSVISTHRLLRLFSF